jgi:hypothetical protein
MNRITALVATVAVCGALGACGGDDDSDGEEEAGAPPTTQEAPPPTTTEDASPGGGATEPGTTLDVGETAHVTYKPLSEPFEGGKTFDLDVTVVEIEKGSIDDFEGIELDAEQRESTPYYVKVRVESTGENVPVGDQDGDPDLGFDGVDDRGQNQSSVTFIGDFPRCQDEDAPSPFGEGESYETCLAYLIPGGGSISEVRWTGSNEYQTEPVVWK